MEEKAGKFNSLQRTCGRRSAPQILVRVRDRQDHS
jgi:hypothetical protein